MSVTAAPGPIRTVFVPKRLARLPVVELLAATRLLLVSRRVLSKSLPVKLVLRTRRVRLLRVTLELALLGPPVPAVAETITSPVSLVVVENCCASSLVTLASRASTRPRRVASSAANSSCSFWRVARSSLLTLSARPAEMISLILSRQAFKPAANS